MSGQAPALGGPVLMEDVSDLLGAAVGDFDTDMGLICREGLTESFLLTLREPITQGAQKIADLIEGIALRPRLPVVSCWTRRRTSSRASPASLTI